MASIPSGASPSIHHTRNPSTASDFEGGRSLMPMDLDEENIPHNTYQTPQHLNDIELPVANGFVLHPPGYFNGQVVDTTALSTAQQPPEDEQTEFGGSEGEAPAHNNDIPPDGDQGDEDVHPVDKAHFFLIVDRYGFRRRYGLFQRI
jgi:hypothetical protein